MTPRKTLTWATALIIVPSLGFFGANAKADILTGESGGVVTSVDLTVVGSINVDFSFGVLEGSSPPPYTLSNTLIDITGSVDISGVLDLFSQSGTGNIFANSDVDGNPGPRTVDALAQIEDFSFDALSTPLISTLVSISNSTDVISSSVSITGSSEFNLTIDGDSDLLGLTLTIVGNPLDLSGFIDVSGDAPPNTVLLPAFTGLAGLTITLNEQIDLGDNVTTFGRQVSALHVNFNNVALGANAINGDVYIARTFALVTVPEPSTGLILALTGLFFGFARRKRR